MREATKPTRSLFMYPAADAHNECCQKYVNDVGRLSPVSLTDLHHAMPGHDSQARQNSPMSQVASSSPAVLWQAAACGHL